MKNIRSHSFLARGSIICDHHAPWRKGASGQAKEFSPQVPASFSGIATIAKHPGSKANGIANPSRRSRPLFPGRAPMVKRRILPCNVPEPIIYETSQIQDKIRP